MTHTTTISHWAYLVERFEKLAKTAERLGVEAPKLVKLAEHKGTRLDPELMLDIPFHEVDFTIEGQPPRYAGWEFLAVIEHLQTPEGEAALVKKSPYGPQTEIDPVFRTRLATCDHCGTKRYRKQTVLLQHEAGEIKQVGTTCLKDFLGHGFPLTMVEDLAELFDSEPEPKSEQFPVSAYKGLLYAASVIRQTGFVGAERSKATGQHRTADLVATWIRSQPAGFTAQFSEVDVDTADATDRWLATLDPEGDEYLTSLKTLSEAGYAEEKHLGLLVSAIPARERWIKEQEKKAAAAQSDTERWPAGRQVCPNDKIEVTGKVISAKVHSNDFGIRNVVTVEDDRGFKVWGTNPKGQFKAGDIVKFVAECEQSDQDEYFGFFKRPSKVAVLTAA